MDRFEILSSLATGILIIVSTLYIIYRYATSTFNYFSDQGIPGPKPVPFFGNLWGIWKANIPEYDVALVRQYGKIFGYFDGLIPNLWVTDPNLIKAICVKDFNHFVDRRHFGINHKIMSKWLALSNGQEWKDIRSSVTPAFTTGKIKRMSELIKDSKANLMDRVTSETVTNGKIDAKIIFTSFAMDVIARCAFGIKLESIENNDDSFITNARLVFNMPSNKTPLILLPYVYPKLIPLMRKLGEAIYVTKPMKYFFRLLEIVIKERSQCNQKYNDFIQVVGDAISELTKEVDGKPVPMWSPEEVNLLVVGQSTLFMVAGFDTTATAITNIFYELAKNPDVQEKLHDSIVEKMDDYDEICHEMIQDMPYLEMVIQEALRFYPPFLRIERQCTKDYSYDNGRIKIKKGQIITIPTYGLHHVEEYYPDPEKFDPERWNPENKAKRSPYTFMPFGTGPRNCIGMNFAMVEMKMAVCSMVQKFRFFPIKETPDELRFQNGFQLVLQPIHAMVGTELRQ